MRGAVTATLDPDSSFVDAKNDPMQPLAWLHPYEAPNGKTGTTFCTTMGASVDLVSEDLRRLLVNAAYFLTGRKVPEHADVAYVDPFYPSFYGFIRDKEHWPSSICSHRIMDWARVPAHPSPRVPLSGITDPDPDFSLKPRRNSVEGLSISIWKVSTPASERSSFASLTDILPLGKANPRVSPLGVKPSPLRSTNMGLL